VNSCAPVYTRVGRKNVTITLDPELVKKAHQLGLNISKIAETALENLVTAVQGSLRKEKVDSWWAGRYAINKLSESFKIELFKLQVVELAVYLSCLATKFI